MQLCNRDTVEKRERAAIAGGVKELELMRRASEALADEAFKLLGSNRTAVVFCGRGKNGGDGYGAASELTSRGAEVTVFDIGDGEVADLTRIMREQYEANGGAVERYDHLNADMARKVRHAGVIVDAMYGIGFHGEFGKVVRAAAQATNRAKAATVSADLPSGTECDSALCAADAVVADVTVAFGCAKPAHCVQPAKSHCGKVVVADIGISREIEKAYPADVALVDDKYVAGKITPRMSDTHKGDYGKLLIVGGSVGYTGAPCLVAEGAIRSGVGVVLLAVPDKAHAIVASACMREAVCQPYPSSGSGFATKAADELLERAKSCDAVVLGPGLGRSDASDKLVLELVSKPDCPLVLDADGINAVSGHIDVLCDREAPTVVTPHDMEFKRLGGDMSVGRVAGARGLAEKLGVVVVLKGNTTVIADPSGRVYVNTTGNPGMAKGGSGDLLAGIIGSLAAQGLDTFDAAAVGVWLHGRAGDLAAAELGEYGMTPTDMALRLPAAIKPFCSRK